MRGYIFLTTARIIDDYINGCIELFLKNNFKIVLLFTIISYICDNDNIQINNQFNTNVEMAIDNRIKDRRGKPLIGNSGITRWKKRYEAGGKFERVVDGVHYRDRVKSIVR